MLVRDIMTKDPTCCTPYTKLDVVAKMMLNHDCGAIPVWDGDQVVGVITDRDIVCRIVAKSMTPVAMAARDAMTKPAYTIGQDEKIEAAGVIMGKRQLRRLPVVDEKGAVVGIVSLCDLAAHLPDTDAADLFRHVSRKTGVATNAAA
ncbi:MAG TPA: CBS domain-containing protein [Thermoanaerobaculia bacterium]|nr:CBS domain-containing protein [Thermoanaerobaculia bacterium]